MTRPVVLGLAGGTASGKTTAAQALAERLGDRCLWVMHDRYYRDLPPEYRAAPERFNFDHPDALETSLLVDHLDALRAGRPARVPRYDFATHRRAHASDWDELTPRPVILVEGILVLAEPALRDRMDHRVFVDAPDDLRLIRRIRRDVAERGRGLADILEQYERTVRPMHEAFVKPSAGHAQLVLDGTAPIASMVDAITALIGPHGPV